MYYEYVIYIDLFTNLPLIFFRYTRKRKGTKVGPGGVAILRQEQQVRYKLIYIIYSFFILTNYTCYILNLELDENAFLQHPITGTCTMNM